MSDPLSEDEQRRLKALRAAIAAGEASGIAKDSSFAQLNAELAFELDNPLCSVR